MTKTFSVILNTLRSSEVAMRKGSVTMIGNYARDVLCIRACPLEFLRRYRDEQLGVYPVIAGTPMPALAVRPVTGFVPTRHNGVC